MKNILLIAISFVFFACSSDDGVYSGGNLYNSNSSSSVYNSGGESSSSNPSSSSSSGDNSGSYSGSYGSVSHGGQSYKTVQIGTQTWFAENLNIDIEGSVCYGNNDANCAKYGRLYNWATAMDLMPGSNGVPEEINCNSSTCENYVSSKHKGICPSGWHIPSNEDWDKLFRYVDDDDGTSSPYTSSTVGKYLKATNGWNNYNDNYGAYGNGEDKYGFAALPGGYGNSGGSFLNVGYDGYWWSASEGNANFIYGRYMSYNGDYASAYSLNRSGLFSVRCLQD